MSHSSEKILVPMLTSERRAVTIVALVAMVRIFGLFALLPVLSLYAGSLEGATPTLIGAAVGGYGLTQAVLQLPLGALSDRIGRLPVLFIGLTIFASGSLIAAASDTIYGVIGGRLLQGAGAISATLTALLADATRDPVRTRGMAIFGVAIGLSFMLAIVIGPGIVAATGVPALFRITAAAAVCGMMLLLLLPRGIERPARTSRPALASAFRPQLLRLDFYVFMLHAELTAMFVALPFLLRDVLGLGVDDHWKLYVGALLVSLAGTVPLVIADDRRGRRGTFTISIACLAVSLLMFAFAGTRLISVFAALAIFFAGFNFLEAGLPARLSRLAHGEVRGASLGVYSSSQFFGAFVGGLAGGWLLAVGETPAVFVACAALAAGWLVLHRFSGTLRESGQSA